MDRCHICDEKVPAQHIDTYVVLNGIEYLLCPLHATQMADYLVTMLQGWLHDRGRTGSPTRGGHEVHTRPAKVPEKGKR